MVYYVCYLVCYYKAFWQGFIYMCIYPESKLYFFFEKLYLAYMH